MKARVALCIILAFAMAITGCSARPDKQANAAETGFYAAGEVAYGGSTQSIEDINAKSLLVDMQQKGDDTQTVLQFTFVTGSRMSGGEQEQAGSGVPAYSVYAMDNPARLVVEIEGLKHWDYLHALDLKSPLLLGTFQHALVDGTRMRIYFQLSQAAFFTAEVEGDTLTIRLLPQKAQDQTLYYVTANAYEQYCAGNIPSECGMAPTLSSNLSSVLLISNPFTTEEEAGAFAAKVMEICPELPEALWRTIELKTGQLPAPDNTLDYLKASGTAAVRLPDGSEKTLPVLAPDGLYLCSLPNNDGFLYSREVRAQSSDTAYQQLYKMKWDGQASLVTAFEFTSIEKAQYSPDGRKLAVLDRVEGSTHLFVFDADTSELLNDLSGMGFGGSTSNFIWNSLGNTVYAVTGADAIQLHQFDYSIPDETNRHSIVVASNVDEGSLGLCNGELYFSHATMEEGSTIYRIKPEGGVRKPFTPGSKFAISADAQYIAIVDSNESGSSSAVLKLYETATGSVRTITSDFYPYDCIWSQDCTRLYYIESRISGGQSEDATSGDAQGEGDDTSDTGSAETPTDDGASAADTDAGDTTAAGDAAALGGEASPTEADAASQSVPADPYPYTLWVYDIATGKSARLLDLAAPDLFAGGRADLLYLNRYETDETGTLIRAAYLLDLGTIFDAPQQASPAPEASPNA